MLSAHRKIVWGSIALLVLMVVTVTVALYLRNASGLQRFAIYLVKDEDRQTSAKTPLDELVLEDMPLLTDQDLVSYRWSDHTLLLADEAAVEERLPAVPTCGLPFVVVVNGERIYYGAFWASYSSQSTDLPIIDIIMDPWQIRAGYPWPQAIDPDVRNDRRIRSALQKLGKLS